jgi:hypothetical protein
MVKEHMTTFLATRCMEDEHGCNDCARETPDRACDACIRDRVNVHQAVRRARVAYHDAAIMYGHSPSDRTREALIDQMDVIASVIQARETIEEAWKRVA